VIRQPRMTAAVGRPITRTAKATRILRRRVTRTTASRNAGGVTQRVSDAHRRTKPSEVQLARLGSQGHKAAPCRQLEQRSNLSQAYGRDLRLNGILRGDASGSGAHLPCAAFSGRMGPVRLQCRLVTLQ
jgi:hypothetical protein